VYSGIAAPLHNDDAHRAAAAIRERISKLASEGMASGVYVAWVSQSISDTLVIDLLEGARARNLLLSTPIRKYGDVLVGVESVT